MVYTDLLRNFRLQKFYLDVNVFIIVVSCAVIMNFVITNEQMLYSAVYCSCIYPIGIEVSPFVIRGKELTFGVSNLIINFNVECIAVGLSVYIRLYYENLTEKIAVFPSNCDVNVLV